MKIQFLFTLNLKKSKIYKTFNIYTVYLILKEVKSLFIIINFFITENNNKNKTHYIMDTQVITFNTMLIMVSEFIIMFKKIQM